MVIHDIIEEYLEAKHHAATHDTYVWYEHYLDVFAKFCKAHHLTNLSDITASHVHQFVAETPTPNSNTRHARAQVVKTFLNWRSEDEALGVKERTVRRIEMPKVQQSDIILFTDQDIPRLFRACDQIRYPHRNRAILHVLLDTGVRVSERAFDATRPEEETGLRMEGCSWADTTAISV